MFCAFESERWVGAGLHLPLGAGTIEVAHYIHLLQSLGYDGTITLEVFSPDKHHLAYSRDVLRRIWDATAASKTDFTTRKNLVPATR